jgi:hypothetical protein
LYERRGTKEKRDLERACQLDAIKAPCNPGRVPVL